MAEEALGAVEVAAVLVHESGHATAPLHIDCVISGSCDQSPEGAYGIEATWADQWLQLNGAAVDDGDARTAEEWIQRGCSHIFDRSGFVPCGG